MVLVQNTSSCHDYYLCQIILKSHHSVQSYGPDTNIFIIAYVQSLHAKCNLILQARDMIFAYNKLFCRDDYLCHTIFTSHYPGQCYGLDTILVTNTHTHCTNIQGKHNMSFCHFMVEAYRNNLKYWDR